MPDRVSRAPARRLGAFLAATLLPAALPAQEAAPLLAPPDEPVHAAIRAGIAGNYAAWGTLDVDAAAPFYAPGVVAYDIIPPVEGYDDWASWSAGLRDIAFAPLSEMAFEMNDDLAVWRAGELAWAVWTFEAPFRPEGGAAAALSGRQTNVYRRHGDDWIVVHEHASRPLGPDAPKAALEAAPTPIVHLDPEDARLAQRVRGWFAAWSTLDPEVAAPFYLADPSLRFVLPGEPMGGHEGWEALARAQGAAFAGMAGAAFVPNADIRVERVGDAAWTTASFSMSLSPEGSPSITDDARVTLVWLRRDGDWRVAHEHLSFVAGDGAVR